MSNNRLEALANLASVDRGNDVTDSSSRDANDHMRRNQNADSTGGGGTHQAGGSSLTAAMNLASNGSSGSSLSTQQLQQLLAAAVGGSSAQQQVASRPNLSSILAGLQQQAHQPQLQTNQSDASSNIMQQLGYYQLIQNAQQGAQNAAQSQSALDNQSAGGTFDAAKAASLLLAGGQLSQLQSLLGDDGHAGSNHQVLPSVGSQSGGGSAATQMPPPRPPQMAGGQADIAPQPGMSSHLDEQHAHYEHHLEDRKQQKRAANRKSAQLSRKRKKQFMEELKEENDDLRRKEQILMSIPDLVVVFDSTGKLWFVSQSVSNFIQFTSQELEGTSIWDRLCEDSVRLLKAAFMDSLAARQPHSSTASLGQGIWELRLVDRDGSQKVITLNGVVHFSGDRPECVCSIRPFDDKSSYDEASKKKKPDETASAARKDDHDKSLIRVKPQQSVMARNSGSDSSSGPHKAKRSKSGRETIRISDSGNSSGESETASGSGSSDD